MKKVLLFLIYFIAINKQGLSQSISPSTVNVTGGAYKGVYMTFEWSVGEMTAIETMSTGNLVLTNGILQPLSPIQSTNTGWDSTELKIYPIPTGDWITIDFFIIQKGYITIMLYDAIGRLMQTRKFFYSGTGHSERMNLSGYASGDYLLNIQMGVLSLSTAIQKQGTIKIQKLK